MAWKAPEKSTIDRAVQRAWVHLVGLVAPDAVAARAEHLWFTLPNGPGAATEPSGPMPGSGPRPMVPPGVPFETDLAGRVVRGHVWGDGPVVYLVHGWGGSAQQLGPLVPSMVAQGLRVVAFDGLSHGRSDSGSHGPTSSDAVELGRGLDAVAARFGPARVVVAHSLGALATMLALRDGWVSTERLVLIAPVEGVPDFMRRLRVQLGFGARVERRLAARAERRTGYPVYQLDVARLGAELERQTDVDVAARPRLLVIHDVDDRETPHEGSATLVRGWPGAQLWSTYGLGHRRILGDPAVAAAVARFAGRRPVDELLHSGDRPQPLSAAEGARDTRVA